MEFEKMDPIYREKHFPQSSVFERAAKKNRGSSIVLIVFLVLLSAVFIAGGVYFISLIRYHMEQGNSESVTIGYGFLAVAALLLLLCILGIVFLAKGLGKGADAVVRASAKASGLSEGELREFDRQAMDSDCYILKLQSAVSAAVSGQSDGLLTRDYLWLGDLQPRVLKRTDIAGACLYEWSYRVNKKRIYCLSISVVNRQNLAVTAEASSERGRALLSLLKDAHPHILVPDGILREGKEYDTWRKEACSAAAQ